MAGYELEDPTGKVGDFPDRARSRSLEEKET